MSPLLLPDVLQHLLQGFRAWFDVAGESATRDFDGHDRSRVLYKIRQGIESTFGFRGRHAELSPRLGLGGGLCHYGRGDECGALLVEPIR